MKCRRRTKNKGITFFGVFCWIIYLMHGSPFNNRNETIPFSCSLFISLASLIRYSQWLFIVEQCVCVCVCCWYSYCCCRFSNSLVLFFFSTVPNALFTIHFGFDTGADGIRSRSSWNYWIYWPNILKINLLTLFRFKKYVAVDDCYASSIGWLAGLFYQGECDCDKPSVNVYEYKNVSALHSIQIQDSQNSSTHLN